MKNTYSKIKLLPLDVLKKTGNVDHADWNYRFFLGYIARQRFRLILKLLGEGQFENLLEIGYGSGIFIPQLASFGKNIYGIDIHYKNETIKEILEKQGVKAKLFVGSAEKMPFEDNFFDGVFSISTLEFIDNLDIACHEIKRVLKKSGSLFVVTPGYSKILDFGLKILTGENAREDFGNRREKIMTVLAKNFEIVKKVHFSKFSLGIKFYTALQLSPLK